MSDFRPWLEAAWESSTWPRVLSAAAIVFAFANLKTLPFAWHVRVFAALFRHLVTRRSRRVSAAAHGGQAIFQPVITTSYNPVMECDFNGHKSNSTFFADLDVSRMHLIATLFKGAISPPATAASHCKQNEYQHQTMPATKGTDMGMDINDDNNNGGGNNKLGRLNCLLGGVSCSFRREIKPLQRFEIWTRVLCWDEKWVYLVSHFVRAGAVKPHGYSLSGSSSSGNSSGTTTSSSGPAPATGQAKATEENYAATRLDEQKALFATSIAKYVFKSGRRTVRPEEVLLELGLLIQPNQEGDVWDRARVEQERLRGMELARQFACLDRLDDAFSGSTAPALGDFGGSFW
ncbi:hypothetical protein F5884DRAFT_447101 [Xylogone sp. PMI_703]|nr:hypothetical protein F5884DRAFT_447101 [Xylogone sp. PMI_703]